MWKHLGALGLMVLPLICGSCMPEVALNGVGIVDCATGTLNLFEGHRGDRRMYLLDADDATGRFYIAQGSGDHSGTQMRAVSYDGAVVDTQFVPGPWLLGGSVVMCPGGRWWLGVHKFNRLFVYDSATHMNDMAYGPVDADLVVPGGWVSESEFLLVGVRRQNGYDVDATVYRVKVPAKRVEEVWRSAVRCPSGRPAMSPDGKFMAFSAIPRGDAARSEFYEQIFILDCCTGEMLVVSPETGEMTTDLAWDLDAKEFVYVRDCGPTICAFSVVDGKERVLCSVPDDWGSVRELASLGNGRFACTGLLHHRGKPTLRLFEVREGEVTSARKVCTAATGPILAADGGKKVICELGYGKVTY